MDEGRQRLALVLVIGGLAGLCALWLLLRSYTTDPAGEESSSARPVPAARQHPGTRTHKSQRPGTPSESSELEGPVLSTANPENVESPLSDKVREALGQQSRDEALGFLKGMAMAQFAHQQVEGAYADVEPCPNSNPGLGRMLWEGPCTDAWEELGWKPADVDEFGDSPTTRCVYSFEPVVDTGLPSSKWSYVAEAVCDGDGDGQQAIYSVKDLGNAEAKTAGDVF
jgi:hypothetical protein